MSAHVAIVGGGFSGAMTAVQLAPRLPHGAGIDIIEPRPVLGGGVAYSARDPAHRINVPASRMTLYDDDPTHFDRWLRADGALDADPAALWNPDSAFPQRAVFGRYVAGQVERARAARPDVTIRHLRTGIEAIAPSNGGFLLAASNGTRLQADCVVLAVSHPPPAVPHALLAAQRAGAPMVPDPWNDAALAAIPPACDVLVAGTGLTMADVVASLERRGHRGRILAVSRRGLLSRGHVFFPVDQRTHFATIQPPATARALCAEIRAEVASAARDGVPWQAVFDDIRINGGRLWAALDTAERRRVARHLRPFWDVHRFRLAPQAEAAIARLRAAGQFDAIAASLIGAVWEGGKVHVSLRPRRARAAFVWDADMVVVTTGPAHGGALASNPALASLARQGFVRADAVGLGLDVDAASHAIGADGVPGARLLVAGPLARARFGELMGLPQVSRHAEAVAVEVARILTQASGATSGSDQAALGEAA